MILKTVKLTHLSADFQLPFYSSVVDSIVP